MYFILNLVNLAFVYLLSTLNDLVNKNLKYVKKMFLLKKIRILVFFFQKCFFYQKKLYLAA